MKDSLINHPFEFTVSFLALFAMIHSADIALHMDTIPAAQKVGILSVSPVLIWIWLFAGFLGACLMLTGLIISSWKVLGREVEAMGLWLSAAMWTSVAVADMVYFLTEDFWTYLGYFAIAIGCLVRLVALNKFRNAIFRVNSETEG